jgi:hypothetical protein
MFPTFGQVARRLTLVALALYAITSAGCLAAAVTGAVVGAGAVGYAYWQGEVPRDYPANIELAWPAAQQAVIDLGMPLEKVVRDSDGGVIETRTGDGDSVEIRVVPKASRVPADGQWTNVTVRVATFGDGKLSTRILDQIDTHLPHPEVVPSVQTQAPVQQTGPPPLAH